MFRLPPTVFAVLLTMLAACGDSSQTPPPVYDFASSDEVITSYLEDTPRLEGANLIIVHRDYGIVHHRSFGAFDRDRISLVASSSKSVTAAVLMALEDEGLLDTNEPLQNYLGWEGVYPDVTVAQLLSNSSGLVGLGPNIAYGPYLCQFLWSLDLASCGEQIFTSSASAPDVLPPDTVFRYGGGQWQVAGAVAETVSGQSWAELFQEIMIEPCGLQNSGYNNHFIQFSGDDSVAYPRDFMANPENLSPTENPNMEGGLWTTTRDYGELLLMQLRGGTCGENRVLSEQSVDKMLSNRIFDAYGGTAGRGGGGYGFGWWTWPEPSAIRVDPGAYGSYPWIDRERGYAAFLIVEDRSSTGSDIAAGLIPAIESAIDNPE
jgi:CubicO group peptidase (beta-lactamase class C family)